MSPFNDDDWLARRIDTLRPGWRGRLVLRAPEETESGATEELFATVVEEPELDRDADEEGIVDATITLCANYRNGRFVPPEGEARFSVRASQVVEMQALP